MFYFWTFVVGSVDICLFYLCLLPNRIGQLWVSCREAITDAFVSINFYQNKVRNVFSSFNSIIVRVYEANYDFCMKIQNEARSLLFYCEYLFKEERKMAINWKDKFHLWLVTFDGLSFEHWNIAMHHSASKMFAFCCKSLSCISCSKLYASQVAMYAMIERNLVVFSFWFHGT